MDIDTCQITGGRHNYSTCSVLSLRSHVQPTVVCFTCNAMTQRPCAFYVVVFVSLTH